MIVDTNGPFSSFAVNLSLNDTGEAVFMASLASGGFGIFTGPDIVTDKVIATGDPLFSSTVTFIGHPVINNSGQIAFVASLADGSIGIYHASPNH